MNQSKLSYSTIAFSILISLIGFFAFLPFDYAIGAFIAFWAFIGASITYFLKQRKKYFFGMSFDDIHVVGLMEDEQIPDVRKEFVKHCVFVPRQKVRKTADKVEARLRAYQNKNFLSGKMKVHRHYYQSGQRVNETPEEYIEYLNQKIASSRLRVHSDRATKGEKYIAVKEEDRRSYFHEN